MAACSSGDSATEDLQASELGTPRTRGVRHMVSSSCRWQLRNFTVLGTRSFSAIPWTRRDRRPLSWTPNYRRC